MRASLTIEIEGSQLKQVDKIAATMGQTREEVLQTALASYLEHNEWMRREIEAGEKEADEGKFASDEEVASVFRSFHTGERI